MGAEDLISLCREEGLNEATVNAFVDAVTGDQTWIDLMENLPPSKTSSAASVDDLSDDLKTPEEASKPAGTTLGGNLSAEQLRMHYMRRKLTEMFVLDTDYLIDGDRLLVTLEAFKSICIVENTPESLALRKTLTKMETLYDTVSSSESESDDSDDSESDGSDGSELSDGDSADESDGDSADESDGTDGDSADESDDDHENDDHSDGSVSDGESDCSSESSDGDLNMAVYGCNKSKTDAACYTLMNLFRSVKTVHESKVDNDVKKFFIEKLLSFGQAVSPSGEY